MTAQLFSLIPFPVQDTPNLAINGSIARSNNILSIHYILAGNLEDIYLPTPINNPTRKDELWQRTCFEFFIAESESSQYWEFNLSPSGDWNVYVMGAYRQVNMREETRIQRLQIQFRKETDCLSLKAAIDLNSIIGRDKPIQAGITSVIQTKEGKESYWALVHPHREADFHVRESFALKVLPD
jgi:hypothetical protein